MEKKWKTNSSIQIYLPHFQTTLWVDLDHVYTLRINAVSKRFLLWIGLVSTLLWCYPQHKSVQFFSTQNGRAEQFLNAFHKVQTTQNRTRKWESFIVFCTTSIFLSVQLKFAFLLPFWLPLRSLIFFCHSWRLDMSLDYSNCSISTHVDNSYQNIAQVLWTSHWAAIIFWNKTYLRSVNINPSVWT